MKIFGKDLNHPMNPVPCERKPGSIENMVFHGLCSSFALAIISAVLLLAILGFSGYFDEI